MVWQILVNILLILSTSGLNAFIASLLHFVIYTFSFVILILLIMLTFGKSDRDYIFNFTGISSTYPIISFSLLLLFFSFIGLPPLPGFWTKFYLVINIS